MSKYILQLILISIFLGISVIVNAAPAYPYKIVVTQADGTTLDVYIHGDEFVHYKTTSDGYNIAQAEDGNYYYAKSSGLSLTPSNIKAHNPSSRTSAEKAQLYQINKGLSKELMQSHVQQKLEQRYREKIQMRKNGYSSPENTTRTTGTISTKSLVILVNFSDVSFKTNSPKQSFYNMLNQTGYNVNGSTGSVKDYFYDNTNGKFNPTFDVYGPYTLSKTMSAYGKNNENGEDINSRQMIIDACIAANNDIDFSQYSSNGSAYVDDIYIYYAGVNEAEGGDDDTIWPHSWLIDSSQLFDGKLLGNYACSSELSGSNPLTATMTNIGTFCHEFGHILNLPDLYDVSYEGYNDMPYSTSLMSNGNYNNKGRTPPALSTIERNIISRYLAQEDWVEITELNSDGDYSLLPIYEDKSYRLNTSNDGEYFILEARSKNNKWDEYITGNTRGAGDGMLIFHVDQSQNILAGGITAAEAWENNTINSNYKHECYKIVHANTQSVSHWFFPGASNIKTLNDNNAEFRLWERDYNNISLNNIVKSGESISFSLVTKKNIPLTGRVMATNRIPVFGASVFLFPKSSSPLGVVKQNGYTLTPIGNNTLTKSSASEKYTTTDANGYFTFSDIAVGNYEMYVSKDNYTDSHSSIAVTPVSPDLEVQLNTANLTGNSIRKSWFTSYTHNYTSDDLPFIIGSAYSLSDLTSESSRMQLVGADFDISATGEYEVIVYKNKTVVGNKTIRVSQKGIQYVDLISLNAIVSTSDEIMVALKINTTITLPVTIDSNNTNKNGAYYSTDAGKTWAYQKYNGTYVVWEIGAYFCDYSPASGISLQTTTASIKAGDYEKIKYSLTPIGSSGELTWSSDNENVAKIDASGVVMALKKGTANITASLGVITSNVAKITVTNNEIETFDTPTVDESAMTASLNWTSSAGVTKWTVRWKGTWDKEYKTLETTNKSATLTDILPNSTYQIEIGGERTYKPEEYWGFAKTSFSTASKPMAERIDISDTDIELSTTSTHTITANTYPSNAWNKELIWSSSNETVATVSQSGLVKALKSGTAIIKVKTKYDDIFAECNVVVDNGIEITPYQNSAYIKWGNTNWTGNWNVIISNNDNQELCNRVIEGNEFYYEYLSPNSTYTFAANNVTTDATQQTIHITTTFTTMPSMNPFAYIDGINGTYNSTDKIQLVLGGVTSPIQTVEWKIDGNIVQPNAPTIVLPAGEHTIVVKITTVETTEYITKRIIVN